MNNWRNNKRITSNKPIHQQNAIQTHPESHNSTFYSLSQKSNHHHPSINEQSTFDRSVLMPLDPSIMLATFKNHWYQTSHIMTTKTATSNGFNPQVPKSKLITSDDISSVVNNIDQMIALLLREANNFKSTETNNANTGSFQPTTNSILDYFLKEKILTTIFNWGRDVGEFTNTMKLEQLKIYELLITQYNKTDCIFQPSVIKPLHKLLSTCSKTCPLEVEKRLVVLLNTICSCIGQNNHLLKLFFIPDDDHQTKTNENCTEVNSDIKPAYFQDRKEVESRFLVFSLLLSFVHREGIIGQQAREGLLQIMPISQTNEALSQYIANYSNLCPVMVTILSGLYSSLPRKLTSLNDRIQIIEEDIHEKFELQIFLSALDFCNAVVQMSHPTIKKQMVDLIFQGFLVPVIGPALHEEMNIPLDILENTSKHSDTVQQIITTTAYLELCLRRVTEPDLLKIFLKFVCVEKFDENRILNTLIARIQATTKLSLITLVLIRTIIDLDCEDVILELLLRYLIDCKNIFDDKHDNDCGSDTSLQFLNSVKKLFTLVPTFSQVSLRSSLNVNNDPLSYQNQYEQKAISTLSHVQTDYFANYFNYLDEAHTAILSCKQKTHSWISKYETKSLNGTNDSQIVSPPSDSGIFLTTSSSSNLDSQKFATDCNDQSLFESCHNSEAEIIGPFLSNLLSRLSQLPFNDFHVNLQLTGLITRLATFPEFHLKSLFLNCDLKLHRNVRSLFSILNALKKQLEEMSTKIDDFHEQYVKEKQNLSLSTLPGRRNGSVLSEGSDTLSTKSNSDKKGKKRRSFKSFLPWVNSNPKLQECPSLESLDNGYKFINKKVFIEEDEGIDGSSKASENLRIIHAAIVFEEFVKELAAISLEHYLLSDIDPDQSHYYELISQNYLMNFIS
ncbi:UPF0518 protein GH13096 isoform X2 [Tetranychus urticae]|uniref:UPF0518 protein GH13096 isoform X2 n=1 Tax=Tetranychus urticae TaxID=32264 RepID=UPI00077BC697|nr:UPF0518 protein GH13096 isoform X2 [Tetranychus urticae]